MKPLLHETTDGLVALGRRLDNPQLGQSVTGGQTLPSLNVQLGSYEAACKAGQSLACHGTELYVHQRTPVLQLGQTMRWQAKQGGSRCQLLYFAIALSVAACLLAESSLHHHHSSHIHVIASNTHNMSEAQYGQRHPSKPITTGIGLAGSVRLFRRGTPHWSSCASCCVPSVADLHLRGLAGSAARLTHPSATVVRLVALAQGRAVHYYCDPAVVYFSLRFRILKVLPYIPT